MAKRARRSKIQMREEKEAIVIGLAMRGFHAKTIARRAGLDKVYHVYNICYKHDIRLRDYRDGKTSIAKQVITEEELVSSIQKIRLDQQKLLNNSNKILPIKS